MPTYQYACTACDEQLEVVQRFRDDPLTVCVACGGRLRKVFAPVGVVFKGSGFYRTDSRAAKNGNGSAADSGSGKGKEGKKPGSAESSPSSTDSSASKASGTEKKA